MTGLRCLSLHQPWASLIAVGVKRIETRSGPTKHRGRIGIASTLRKPVRGEDVGDWWADYDDERWIIIHDYKPDGHWRQHDAPLGALVATANLVDCAPIGGPTSFRTGYVEGDEGDYPGQHVVVYEPINQSLTLSTPDTRSIDITDQAPYGDYAPGRWAWLLDDVKATTERCPACWGDGGFKVDSMILYGIPGGEDWGEMCDVCKGDGKCDPVPVKGRQGLWRWEGTP